MNLFRKLNTFESVNFITSFWGCPYQFRFVLLFSILPVEVEIKYKLIKLVTTY